MAVLISLIALSVLSLLGLYMTFNASTEAKISDNFESQVQAREAAVAGLAHAREAIRGIKLDDLLQGPDGTYPSATASLTAARAISFRNPIPWNLARTLNIVDPSADVAALTDDGLINTGLVGTVPGTLLVPKTGIAFTSANPVGSGVFTTARYFAKVSDNNGEASEIAKDATNNPFVDFDRVIIVRATGVARTIRDGNGIVRSNSVVVVESRFRQDAPFSLLGAPFVVVGSNVNPNFSGNAFDITGPSDGYGIATIDTNTTDGSDPSAIIKTAANGKGRITGGCTGLDKQNCIGDITATVSADSIQAKIKDPVWLWDFVYNQVPAFADNFWDGVSPVDLGTTASPKTTYINGDASLTGDISGAGLLVVTGSLTLGGTFSWDGLVIVTGTGFMWTHGMNRGIYGGIILANLVQVNGVPTFGTPTVDIRGNSNISTYDANLTLKSNGLVPLKQLSFREITSVIDP